MIFETGSTKQTIVLKKPIMKSTHIITMLAVVFITAAITSCNPSKKEENSVKVAKEANDENLESRKDEKDADFIVEAVAGNYAEIKMAQMALTSATHSEVKNIARTLETAHTKLLTELKGYANKNGISIPLEESEEAKNNMKDLTEKDAKDFDKKWCSLMVNKHEKTISSFEDRWNKTEDPELKDWINKTLPGLKSHLDMLKEHEEKMKDMKSK